MLSLAAFGDDVFVFDQHKRLLEILQLVRPTSQSPAEGRQLHIFLPKRAV
jgi:hypothetical protein